MNNSVSIIIPVYNSEKYLNRCFSSVINQTYENLEIVFINDGSTDNSLAILESYKNKYYNVKILNQNNQGQAAARNNGMKVAAGDYFMFVDSDDYIDLDMVNALITCANKRKKDIIFCDYTKIFNNKTDYIVLDCDENSDNVAIIEQSLKYNIISSPCGKLFNNKIIDLLNFPTNKLFEDSYVMIDLIVRYDLGYTHAKGYYYDLRNTNSTTRKSSIINHYPDLIKAMDISKKAINMYYPQLNNCMEFNSFINYFSIYRNCLLHNVYSKPLYDAINNIKLIRNSSIFKYALDCKTILRFILIKYFTKFSIFIFKLRLKM